MAACKKILYPTKELAERHGKKLRLRVYPCHECGGFHLTRKRRPK